MSKAPPIILLVDDNEDDTLLIREAFLVAGLPSEVFVVCDGVEALDFLNQRGAHADAPRPDVVLLDLNMPRLDGFGVLKALSKQADLVRLPVVILSTSDHAGDVEKALALGAREYMSKPIGFDRLCQMARQFLGKWSPPPDRPDGRISA